MKKAKPVGPSLDAAARARDLELRALVAANPTDIDALLVYADWLEERGDLARASFLRMQQALRATKLASPRLLVKGRALFDLGKTLDPAWVAAVTHPKLGGTVWDGGDDDGDLTWRFLTNGFINYTQPSGTYENGRWEQIGSTVAMDTNAHYADYFGVIVGDTIRGNAHNIVAHKWRWKVTRTSDPSIVAVPDNTNRTIHDNHVNAQITKRKRKKKPAAKKPAPGKPAKRKKKIPA